MTGIPAYLPTSLIPEPSDIISPLELEAGILNGSIQQTDSIITKYTKSLYLAKLMVKKIPLESRKVSEYKDTDKKRFFMGLVLFCHAIYRMNKNWESWDFQNSDAYLKKIEILKEAIEEYLEDYSNKFLNKAHIFLEYLKDILILGKTRGTPEYTEKYEILKGKIKSNIKDYLYDFLPQYFLVQINTAYYIITRQNLLDSQVFNNLIDISAKNEFTDSLDSYGLSLSKSEEDSFDCYKKMIECGDKLGYFRIGWQLFTQGHLCGNPEIVRLAIKFLEKIAEDHIRVYPYLEVMNCLFFLIVNTEDEEEKAIYSQKFDDHAKAVFDRIERKGKRVEFGQFYFFLAQYYQTICGDIQKSIQYAEEAAKLGIPFHFYYLYMIKKTPDIAPEALENKTLTTISFNRDPLSQSEMDKIEPDEMLRLGVEYHDANCLIENALIQLRRSFLEEECTLTNEEKISIIKKALHDLRLAKQYPDHLQFFDYKEQYQELSRSFPAHYRSIPEIKWAEKDFFQTDVLIDLGYYDAYTGMLILSKLEESSDLIVFYLQDDLRDSGMRLALLEKILKPIIAELEKLKKSDSGFLQQDNNEVYLKQLSAVLKFVETNHFTYSDRFVEIFNLAKELYWEITEKLTSYREKKEKEVKASFDVSHLVPKKSRTKNSPKRKGKKKTTRPSKKQSNPLSSTPKEQPKPKAVTPSHSKQQPLSAIALETNAVPKKASPVKKQTPQAKNSDIRQRAQERLATMQQKDQDFKNFYKNNEMIQGNKFLREIIDALFNCRTKKSAILDYTDMNRFANMFFGDGTSQQSKGTGGGYTMSYKSATFTVHKTVRNQRGHAGAVEGFKKFLFDAFEADNGALQDEQ